MKSTTEANTSITDDVSNFNDNLMTQIFIMNKDLDTVKKDTKLALSSIADLKCEFEKSLQTLNTSLREFISTHVHELKAQIDSFHQDHVTEMKSLPNCIVASVGDVVKSCINTGIEKISGLVESGISSVASNNIEVISGIENSVKNIQEGIDIMNDKMLAVPNQSNIDSASRSDLSILHELLQVPQCLSSESNLVEVDDNSYCCLVAEGLASLITKHGIDFINGERFSKSDTKRLKKRKEVTGVQSAKASIKKIKSKLINRTGTWTITNVAPPAKLKLKNRTIKSDGTVQKTRAQPTTPKNQFHAQSNKTLRLKHLLI